jgi:MFS family permease
MNRSLGAFGSRVADFWTDLWRDGRGWVLVVVSVGWMLVLGGRIVYPALLPLITAEFGIDYATAGLLVGVLWTSYSLMQFPGGVVADWAGERAVLTLSLVASFVGMTAIFLAPVFGAFVVATAVLGVGNGLYGTTRVTVLSDTFPDMDTTAISINQATGNLGNTILPVVAGAIAAAVGWRLGFGFLVPLFALTAVGVWVVVPRRTSPATDDDESVRETMRAVAAAVRGREVLMVTGVLFLLMFLYQSVTGFLTTYLVEAKGLGAGTAATLYGVFFASATVCQFASGLVADRYGQRAALSLFLGAAVPAFLALPFASGVPQLLVVVVLLSATLGAFPPSHAYTVRAIPSDVQGSGYGLLRTFYIAFGATGPPLVGLLADVGRFDEAFFLLAGVALLASVASRLLPSVAPDS